MAIENSLEGLNLSPSVRRVAEKYLEWEFVSPLRVVHDLLENHPSYGGGRAAEVRYFMTEREDGTGSGEMPIDVLLRAAREMYRPEVRELHTRLVVITSDIILTEAKQLEAQLRSMQDGAGTA